MGRAIEWILAVFGAATALLVSGAATRSAAGDPGALSVLAAVAVLGFGGFGAVALDGKGRSQRWGAIAWLAAGALSALVLLGAFSYGPYLLPAVLALAGAALLADRRRARSALHHLGLFVTGALGCALVVVLANLGGWL